MPAGVAGQVALTSAAVVLAVAAFAALAVVAVPVGWDRGRHPVVRRSTTVLTATLTVLLAVGVFVNSQAGFFPTLSSVVAQGSAPLPVGAAGVVADLGRRPYDLSAAAVRHRAGHGVVVRIELGGGRSGISRPGAVYLPDAYFTSTMTRFPVIEVLSGSPGNPAQMLSQLHLAAAADQAIAAGQMAPTVLVVPDTNGSRLRDRECADVPGGPQDEVYLSADVPRAVSQLLRVAAPGPGWAVLGTSTGGFCATDLLLRHPERYAAAASLSGYYRALTDVTTGRLYPTAAQRDAHDPLWRLSHLPRPDRALWVSAGTGEPGEYRQLGELLALPVAPLRVTAVSVPGAGHSFAAWRAVLPQALAFLSAELPPALRPTAPVAGQVVRSARAG